MHSLLHKSASDWSASPNHSAHARTGGKASERLQKMLVVREEVVDSPPVAPQEWPQNAGREAQRALPQREKKAEGRKPSLSVSHGEDNFCAWVQPEELLPKESHGQVRRRGVATQKAREVQARGGGGAASRALMRSSIVEDAELPRGGDDGGGVVAGAEAEVLESGFQAARAGAAPAGPDHFEGPGVGGGHRLARRRRARGASRRGAPMPAAAPSDLDAAVRLDDRPLREVPEWPRGRGAERTVIAISF